jgi:hypothetical protein
MMKYLKSRYVLSLFCTLALALVLVAWGHSAATPASAAYTAPKTLPAVKLAIIKGSGFTINSPTGWASYKSAASGISVLMVWPKTSRSTFLIVETFANTRGLPSKGAVKAILDVLKGQGKNGHTKNVPATVTINRTTWAEGAITTTDPSLHTNLVINVIATTYPRNANKLVIIIRIAKVSDFNKLDANEFKHMLSSFKFA